MRYNGKTGDPANVKEYMRRRREPIPEIPTCIVTYARFSPRPKWTENESIEKQRERIAEYCAARGWEIRAEFKDEHSSGADDKRIGLWDAVANVPEGGAIVVDRIDRVARDSYLFAFIERTLEIKRCRFISVHGEGTESTSAESRLVRQIFQALAEYGRAVKRAQCAAACRRRVRQGIAFGDPKRQPYGKMLKFPGSKEIVDCPDERKTLDMIQWCIDRHMGNAEIANYLNKNGRRTRKGERFYRSYIRRIIGAAIGYGTLTLPKDA